MRYEDYGPRRLLDVAFFTAAAFVAGGFLQRFLAAELVPAGGATDAFTPLMIVPILGQGAVGFLGLAWILRDRFPLVLLWVSGMLGWTLASMFALILTGWSFYTGDLIFLVGLVTGGVGLVTGVVMASMLQVGASAILKMGVAYTFGFAAAWVALILALAGIAVLLRFGQMDIAPGGLAAQSLLAVPTLLHDAVIGIAAAVGVAWALGPAMLPDGSTVRYVLIPSSARKSEAGVR